MSHLLSPVKINHEGEEAVIFLDGITEETLKSYGDRLSEHQHNVFHDRTIPVYSKYLVLGCRVFLGNFKVNLKIFFTNIIQHL